MVAKMSSHVPVVLLITLGFFASSKASGKCCVNGDDVILLNDDIFCGPINTTIKNGNLSLVCDHRETIEYRTNFVFSNGTMDKSDIMFQDGSVFPYNKYCFGRTSKQNSMPTTVVVCKEQDPDAAVNVLYNILEGFKILSTFMLLLTCGIYMVLRKLRDLQGSCILNFLICYFIAYTIWNMFHYANFNICPSKAYLFYFFTLSSFGWLCVFVFNTWKNLLLWNTNYVCTYITYLTLIYGGSTVALISMLFTQRYGSDNLKPNFSNETHCWFAHSNLEWWWFYLPIEVHLTLAAFFLIDCCRRMWQMCTNRMDNSPEMKALYNSCSINFKLYLVIGSAWILQIISDFVTSPSELLIFLVELFISLQGIMIFIVLIATEKKTLHALGDSEHYGCNLFPTTWTPVNNKEQPQPRYCPQNGEMVDVDLTSPVNPRRLRGRRHNSLGS